MVRLSGKWLVAPVFFVTHFSFAQTTETTSCNGYPVHLSNESPCCTSLCTNGCLQGGVHQSTKCEEVVEWKKEMGADVRSSPTLNSESSVVYIGVMNEVHEKTPTGGIFALDSGFQDWYDGGGGRLLASHTMEASCAGTAVLSKDDSMAFIGCDDGLHAFSLGVADASFFNSESASTHFEEMWHFSTPNSPIESTPVLSADESVLYLTSLDDGYLYALQTQAVLPNGTDRELWKFGPANISQTLMVEANNPGLLHKVGSHAIFASPALSPAGDKVYFVGYASFLLCLNTEDGSVDWISSKFSDLGALSTYASPVLSLSRELVYLGSETGFAAYNSSTGAVAWKDTFASTFQPYRTHTASVYANGNGSEIVFFGRDDWNLYAYDSFGKRVGRFKTGDRIRSPPILHPTEPVVYIGGSDRQMRSVRFSAVRTSEMPDTSGLKFPFGLGIFAGTNEADVEYEWTYLAGGQLLTTPTISNDGHLIYFGSLDHVLYAAHSGKETTTTTQTTLTTTTTSATTTSTTATSTTTTSTTATSTTATTTTTKTATTTTTSTTETTTTTTFTATTTTGTTTTLTSTSITTRTSTTVTSTSSTTTTTVTSTTMTTLISCSDDEYRTAGNACSSCANITCAQHYYRSGECADDVNGYACHVCNNLACGANEYRVGNCSGTHDNYTCHDHTVCNGGQYLAGATIDDAGQCLPCPSESFRPAVAGNSDGHRNSTCLPWQTCKPTQFAINGSALQDRKCLNQATCDLSDGVYESVAATPTTSRICSQLSDCVAGEYIEVDASPSSDRKCKECGQYTFSRSENANSCVAMATCGQGQKASGVDRNMLDLQCVDCGPNTYQALSKHRKPACEIQPVCGAGQYTVETSAITRQVCAQCQKGTYQNETGHRHQTCVTQTTCGKGEQISADSLIEVRSCSRCEAGTYQDADDRHQKESCIAQPLCTFGEYIFSNKNGMVDRSSRASCLPCPLNTYQEVLEHRFPQCNNQPMCTFGERITERINPDGAETALRSCKLCSVGTFVDVFEHRIEKCTPQPNCSAGERYILNISTMLGERASCLPCEARTYRKEVSHQEKECLPWTECSKKQDVAINGSSIQNRVCGSAEDGCNTTKQYESQSPSANLTRLCTGLTDCLSGNYISVANSATSDRVCGACDGSATWQNETNQLTCKAMSTCSVGERVDSETSGNRVRNLECIPCTDGTFQPARSHRDTQCLPHRTCSYGQQVKDLTSTAAPATCEECPQGQYQPNSKHQNTTCFNYTVISCGLDQRLVHKGDLHHDQACEPCPAGTIQPFEVHDKEECDAATTPTSTPTSTATSTATSTPTSHTTIVDDDSRETTTTTPAVDEGLDASEVKNGILSANWQWIMIGVGVVIMFLIIGGIVIRKRGARAEKHAEAGATVMAAMNPALDPAVAAIMAGLSPDADATAVGKGRASAKVNATYTERKENSVKNGEDTRSDDDGYLDVVDSAEASSPAQAGGLYAMAAGGGRKFEVVSEALYDHVGSSYGAAQHGAESKEYSNAVLNAMVGEDAYGTVSAVDAAAPAYDNPNAAIPSLGNGSTPLYATAAGGSVAPLYATAAAGGSAAAPLYVVAAAGGSSVRAKRSIKRLDTIDVMQSGGYSHMVGAHALVIEEPAYQMASGIAPAPVYAMAQTSTDGPTYAVAGGSSHHVPSRQQSFHEQTQEHVGHSLYDVVPGSSENVYSMAANSGVSVHGATEPAVYAEASDFNAHHDHAIEQLGESTYQEVAYPEPAYALAAGVLTVAAEDPTYAMAHPGPTPATTTSATPRQPTYAIAANLAKNLKDSEYDLDTGYIPANTAVRSRSNRRASTIAADGAIIYQDEPNADDELAI